MIEFEIKEGKLVVNAKLLTVPILRKIYERDKSTSKEHALKDLLYIYHMGYHKSPYANLDEDEKQKHVKKKVYGNEHEPKDEVVEHAIDEYVKVNITAEDRLIYNINKKIDELTKWIYDRKVDDKTGDSILEMVPKIDKLLEARDKIKARIEKNIASGQVRGNKKLSLFEQRMMNNLEEYGNKS